MNLIDTHAHLDTYTSDSALSAMLKRSIDAGVDGIITCCARFEDWDNYSQIAKTYKKNIWWQFGIHPTEACEDDFSRIESAFEKYMNSDAPPISIGEIGLDFYRLPPDENEAAKIKNTQAEIFKLQLSLAKKSGLPVCIHARSAINESVEIIKDSGVDFSKTVFHCFSGNSAELKLINELGGRASFTGIITYKNADIMREAMLAQGPDKIMFETDCPYLAPVPMRGKENEPAYLAFVAQKAAELFGVDLQKMAQISTNNAINFFKLQ